LEAAVSRSKEGSDMDKPIKIDSRGKKKKHVRHLATITRYKARTKCNRLIIAFWTADQVSYFYTDGSRYSHPCRICLPDDYAAYTAAN
jgi:hypothetical protein